MNFEEYLRMQKKNAGNDQQNAVQEGAALNRQNGAALDRQKTSAGNVSLAATTRDETQEQQNAQQEQQTATQQAFVNPYQGNLDSIYQQVMNWGNTPFSYDVANDPLYQQYANQYAQMGNLAMQDTIGNASALTGGYGNSWAATVGNQAYQGYLQQLAGKVPELYQQAYNQYLQEGQNLQSQLALTQGLHNDAWQNYLQQQQFGQSQQQNAFAQVTAMLEMGMMPSAELLGLAGMTEEQAQEYINQHHNNGGGNNRVTYVNPFINAALGTLGLNTGVQAAQQAAQAMNQNPAHALMNDGNARPWVFDVEGTAVTPENYSDPDQREQWGVPKKRK